MSFPSVVRESSHPKSHSTPGARLGGRSLACWLGVAFLAGGLAVSAQAALSTVKLKSGATLQGEVLSERPDRLVVDLGYTVLTVPRDEVEQLSSEDISTRSSLEESGDLYRIASGAPTLSVKENVSRVGEAVVQVRTPSGLGSGFIIHPSGFIVTNEHVVAGEYNLIVTLFRKAANGTSMEVHNKVRIVALDSVLDLALLKLEDVADDAQLPTVPLGDAGALTEGQGVFAVGSPLGLDRTVSQGIVSSRNRPMGGQLYIQTTTQINPGNSGGPLFNLRGEVVGVNNMKPMIAGIEGLNFAIPATVLKMFLRNRDAFAFDARNPNAGYRYLPPPQVVRAPATPAAGKAK